MQIEYIRAGLSYHWSCSFYTENNIMQHNTFVMLCVFTQTFINIFLYNKQGTVELWVPTATSVRQRQETNLSIDRLLWDNVKSGLMLKLIDVDSYLRRPVLTTVYPHLCIAYAICNRGAQKSRFGSIVNALWWLELRLICCGSESLVVYLDTPLPSASNTIRSKCLNSHPSSLPFYPAQHLRGVWSQKCHQCGQTATNLLSTFLPSNRTLLSLVNL